MMTHNTMPQDVGVVYVSYGQKARESAIASMQSVRRFYPNVKIAVITDDELADFRGVATIRLDIAHHPDESQSNPKAARAAKVQLDQATPFQYTIYLDADTMVRAPMLHALYAPLRNQQFDFVATLSKKQGDDFCWHASETQRDDTRDGIGFTPLQIQAGVFAFRRSRKARAFFAAWRREWLTYSADDYVDQAAFTRALHKRPMAIHLLGHDYNGGAVIEHIFGQAKE